jgi:hypothetical protein
LYAYSYESLLERGTAARNWLKGRPEKVIAVVGHDGFLRVGICGKKFGNADFRTFEFEAGGEGEGSGLGLVEWESTEKNGDGLGTCPNGVWGWLPNDFKYMPLKPTDEVVQTELAKTEKLSSSLLE